MKLRRLKQVCQYGWKDAAIICKEDCGLKSRWSIFLDMLYCYLKYNVWTNQYKKEKLYSIDRETRKDICLNYKEKNTMRDQWVKKFFNNYKFLNKWSNFKYERSARLLEKRCAAYQKQYGLGDNLFVQYGVTLICQHYSTGKITCGKNLLLARGCDIDYTGDLEIGDNVGILEGAKILTHAHDSYHFMKEEELIPFSNRAYKTNLKIGNNVSICAHAVILPGVTEIGENSIISAGAIVNRPVPANVIVAGNPAVVVRKIPAIVKRTKH